MKIIIRALLALTLLFSSGCAMSSTYSHYQRSKPAAIQTKAQSLGILHVRASADGDNQQLLAGVDLSKINASLIEVLSEDPSGSARAIGWDAIKLAIIGYGANWLNEEYSIIGGSNKNDEPTYTGPVINAQNGGNIEVNGAQSNAYNSHNLNAQGQGSSIKLNYYNPEEEESAPFVGQEP